MSPPLPLEDERRRRIITSNARWRWIFALLAIAVPLTLGSLFRRQELRLRALADHGRPGVATLTEVTHESAFYRYVVDGQTYTWSVAPAAAPHAPGSTFPITYLPEHPDLSRPVATYGQAQLDADVDLTFQHRLLGGLFGFLALAAVGCEVGLRRMRRGEPLRTGPRVSPEVAGRVLAVLFIAIPVWTAFDPQSVAVEVALFGPTRFGLPVAVVFAVALAILALPLFWVTPALMRIVMDAAARGQSISKGGIVVAVATARPELRRARAIVLAGLVYFVLLLAAWIALTDSRGV